MSDQTEQALRARNEVNAVGRAEAEVAAARWELFFHAEHARAHVLDDQLGRLKNAVRAALDEHLGTVGTVHPRMGELIDLMVTLGVEYDRWRNGLPPEAVDPRCSGGPDDGALCHACETKEE